MTIADTFGKRCAGLEPEVPDFIRQNGHGTPPPRQPRNLDELERELAAPAPPQPPNPLHPAVAELMSKAHLKASEAMCVGALQSAKAWIEEATQNAAANREAVRASTQAWIDDAQERYSAVAKWVELTRAHNEDVARQIATGHYRMQKAGDGFMKVMDEHDGAANVEELRVEPDTAEPVPAATDATGG